MADTSFDLIVVSEVGYYLQPEELKDLVEQQRVDSLIPGQLRLLLEVVARACKSISQAVNKGALGGVLGSADSENVQGEMQKKLDIIANEVLIEANEWGGHLAAMASEEMDGIYVVPNRYPQGEYLLLFDPLDPELAKQTKEAQQFKVNRSLRDVEAINVFGRSLELD